MNNNNSIPTADLFNVQISFELPSSLVFFQAASSPTLEVICGPSSLNAPPQTDEVLCHIPMIPAGSMDDVEITILISHREPAGVFLTTFTIDADGLQTPIQVEAMTTVLESSADLGITLTGSLEPLSFEDQQVNLTSEVTYTGATEPNAPFLQLVLDPSLSFTAAETNGTILNCTVEPFQFVLCPIPQELSTTNFNVTWVFDKVAEAGSYFVSVEIADNDGPSAEQLAIPDLNEDNNRASFSASTGEIILSVTAEGPLDITTAQDMVISFSVTNTGTILSPATSLMASLPIAPSEIPTNCTPQNELTLECDLGELLPSQSTSFDINFVPTVSGNLTIIGVVQSNAPVASSSQIFAFTTVNVAQPASSAASLLSVSSMLLLSAFLLLN